MAPEKYNTNLAAEFYVLSALHRLGSQANLTLGNKKAVDIVVVHDAGDAVTVDVKGVAGTTNWPVDNVKEGRKNHFLVFVCFLDKMQDLTAVPEIYILPSDRLREFTYCAPGGRRVVRRSTLRNRDHAKEFRDPWHLILGTNRRAM